MGSLDSVKLISQPTPKKNMGQLMLKAILLLLVTSASVYGIDPNVPNLVAASGGCDTIPPSPLCFNGAAVAYNLTSLTGTAGTGSVTIGSSLGDQKSCPPLYPCRRGNKCCYRRPGRRCNYRHCI